MYNHTGTHEYSLDSSFALCFSQKAVLSDIPRNIASSGFGTASGLVSLLPRPGPHWSWVR